MYGLRRRQLYRCRPNPPAVLHTFTAPTDEIVRHFHYPIDEIAHALVLLGRGTSFYLTALEARDRSGRKPSQDTNLSVYWLERFAPLVLAKLLPQPGTLGIVLIDQVPFHVAAQNAEGFPIPGGRMRFTVFGAASQRRKGEPLTLLRLRASWHKDLGAWRQFIKSVPGEAERIVCDGESAIQQVARLRWPEATLAISEWHLLHRADEILVAAGRHSRKDPLYRALRTSLSSAADWRRFVRLARRSKLARLEAWIGEVEAVVDQQLRRRDHPKTTGALETQLRDLKKMLTLQRGSYDQLPRLNLVLGLMTLRANHVDRERQYAEIIREGRERG